MENKQKLLKFMILGKHMIYALTFIVKKTKSNNNTQFQKIQYWFSKTICESIPYTQFCFFFPNLKIHIVFLKTKNQHALGRGWP